MTTTAYTVLEQLLVFQALRAEGVESHSVFNRISDQLKSIPLVHNDTSYDSGRLSPDALRELYLWLLKEEVKADLERRLDGDDLANANGDIEPGSRKRKLPSPKLATVHEASQHAHLIPQLVTRLYARYREIAVREIKESERRYDNATKELGEIEAGKWDERLERQRTASATQSPRPSTKAHTQPNVSHVQASKSGTASPITRHESIAPAPPKRSSGLDALLNHGPDPANGTPAHRRNSSNTTLPPLSEMAPDPARFGIPPKFPTPAAQQTPHAHPYAQSPTNAHHSPYPGHGGIRSPQVQQSLSRPSSSSSAKPFLPPPPGMTLPPPTPSQYGSPSLRGPHQPPHQPRYPHPPQHRLSTEYSPTNERAPMAYAPPPPLPPQNYYQPQQQYSDRRTSYPAQPQYQQQPHPPYAYQAQHPNAGGYQLQPFSVEPQQPIKGQTPQPLVQQQQQQQAPIPHQTPTHAPRPPGSFSHQHNAPSTMPHVPSQANPEMSRITAALGTPQPSSEKRTQWKSARRPAQLTVDRELPSPVPFVEPLSPVQKRSDLVAPPKRSARIPEVEKTEVEPPPRPKRGRGRPKRDRSPQSVISSTADESARVTRSHSVSNVAGAMALLSDDRPGSLGHVKVEPETPGLTDEAQTPVELQSGAGGMITRKRRGTMQAQPQPPPKKRRRTSTSAAPAEDEPASPGPPPTRSTTVTATKHFAKTSQTIMNDINSHKHASYFANAVRDRDAPGYSEIIKQPQHLRSIRTAISAGSRAVNAAAAAAATSESPSATAPDGSVELERSAELVPPQAIVNAAQLEKEVMRMFANAIMFNPGEDGLVADTREMAEDVEAQVRQWRGFGTEGEREGATAEVEEVEEETRGPKRRKV